MVALCVTTPAFSQQAAETQTRRQVLNRVAPQYPAMARNLSLSGTVKVEALVSSNGTVKNVALKGGHPVLAQAAINAVREWKWEAGPRETVEAVELRFTP